MELLNSNITYYLLWFSYVYFLLRKLWTIKLPFFSFKLVLRSGKKHNKYYVIFKIQNSNFSTLENQWMSYQWMAKRHYNFWTKFSYSGCSERDWKKDDPSPFSFFFQKVKFWGLIFQSGPRNRESTFWKTAAVKSEKVKFLPFCHRTLRSDWSTRRNWTNSFYFLHRKRSSKFMSYLVINTKNYI